MLRLLCNELSTASSLNPVSRQLKLRNIFIFRMAYPSKCWVSWRDVAIVITTDSSVLTIFCYSFPGFALQASAFVISVHLENVPVGVAVLIIGGGLEGLAWAGFAVNHLDLAPRYSSILFGITNTCATIPGILSPLFVGYVAVNKVIFIRIYQTTLLVPEPNSENCLDPHVRKLSLYLIQSISHLQSIIMLDMPSPGNFQNIDP